MLKMAGAGLIVIALSCGGFYGYRWYATAPTAPEPDARTVSLEDAKTDFISIAVFKDGKVEGYVSFRAELTLKNADKATEAGYIISDTIHRRLEVFSELFGVEFDPKDAKLIEEPLFAALVDRMGKDEIGSLKLADVAFDKRIQ